MYDAVIVGARAAGAATGMLLAREGLDVLVVDRTQYGRDTLSTHGLMRGGVMQLHRWGVLDAIRDANTPPVRRVLFNYEDGTAAVTIKPAAGVDALYAPRRTVLDTVLVDAARGAGATVEFGTSVTGLLRDDNGRVRGIETHDRAGKVRRISADLTIGADGMHSFVARAVEAPTLHQAQHASALVYGYWSDLPTEGYEWFWPPNAMGGFIPTNNDEVCVAVGAAPDRLEPDDYYDLLAYVAPNARDRLATAKRPERLRYFAGLPGYVKQATGPGWALVGDAGYWKDPLSIHGLTDALRDAELFARAFVAGDVDAYPRERDRLSHQLFTVVDELASYQWDTPQVRQLLLELSSAMSLEVEAILASDNEVVGTLLS